ncbi:MAG: LptF/LptG family permease [Lentisphaerae bacterium]|nr:LptF/LptG family permease [Lentisphaerota bacterium]
MMVDRECFAMRILYRYITRECLVAFVVTLLIFMFVMAVGNVFKIIDFFVRGVSGRLILQVFSYGIPFSLIFAIPMSVLAAVFLTYSRMASDREISMPIWRPPVILPGAWWWNN